jgi:DegV family protein with EDD domain
MVPVIRIVTDTTASLPPEYLRAHPVEVVPQIVMFGETSFKEEQDLTYADFIQRLQAADQLPQTAAPPPGLLVAAYQRQLAQAQTVLSIHPSLDLSGTVRSAYTAIEESFPTADIRVLDTRTIAGNLATMVKLAVEWAESGIPASEIIRRLQALIPCGRIYFLVDTLKYLQMGGRIGGASALIGNLLHIKPILQLQAGRVEALEKVRTQRLALERLKELAITECPHAPEAYLCVMHADNPLPAQALAAELQTRLDLPAVPIYPLGAAITTHVGPGTLALGFFT